MHSSHVEIAILGSALGAHPGAEIVGVVQKAGESAQHLLGKTVVAPRLLSCGECDLCRRGRIANCSALHPRSSRPEPVEVLPARFLIPLELPANSETVRVGHFAALADALLAPYAGLVRAGVSPGTLVVVLGGGSRGALSVVVARMLGAQVVILAPSEAERSLLTAPPYGALAALDPTALGEEAAREALRKLAVEAGLPSHGLCLLETSGSDAGRARALSLLETGGTAVLLDRAEPLGGKSPGLPAELPAGPGLGIGALLERVTAHGSTVLGGGSPHPDLLPELLALLTRAGVDLTTFTRAVTPSEIDEVMAARRASLAEGLASLTLPIVCFEALAKDPGQN